MAAEIKGKGIHLFEFPNYGKYGSFVDLGPINLFQQFADQEIIDFKGSISYLNVLTSRGVYFCDIAYNQCKFLDTRVLMENPVRLLYAKSWLEGGYKPRSGACLQDISGATACSDIQVLDLPSSLADVKINELNEVDCYATDKGIACPE